MMAAGAGVVMGCKLCTVVEKAPTTLYDCYLIEPAASVYLATEQMGRMAGVPMGLLDYWRMDLPSSTLRPNRGLDGGDEQQRVNHKPTSQVLVDSRKYSVVEDLFVEEDENMLDMIVVAAAKMCGEEPAACQRQLTTHETADPGEDIADGPA